MNDVKLTVRLPREELDFAREYALEHGFSLTALIHRHLASLRETRHSTVPREVAAIAGLVPSKVDARREHRARLEAKHR